ncbi:hypothetical protein QRX50_20815 [Amycolatopsis carbonis]|uniref:Uncharacterized protein n=1 Tax=Amycolatopsis carbonis TaxID=715471 RepID=A0A9Y2IPH4_9PSEU|nr:hypothetical protein [Amycolatopsis sp. 2-15]WIX83026.1 hypothetical protein QRX50_20815 [Amycolatopsis sp. 2-15]
MSFHDEQRASVRPAGLGGAPGGELEQLRDRVAELEAQLRSVYADRMHLLAALAADPGLNPRLKTDPTGLPGYKTVLYLTDPDADPGEGQMSFPIADADLTLIEHVPWATEGDPHAAWDGTGKNFVLARLRNLAQHRADAARAMGD